MTGSWTRTFCCGLLPILFAVQGCGQAAREIERPEKIVSKRLVVYDTETYAKLSDLWKAYYREFPSEDAYANWMYAARYAGDPDYETLLDKGVKKYPANPTLLYLCGIKKHGCHDDLEGQNLLERAARLDPSYMDPWFALVTHYIDRDEEKVDVALRRLLEGGAIPDDIMDYSYNMLASLDENAILITNGDMDTYPGWILMRLLKHRPDVTIANRSLLNTDWYPFMLMEAGLPKFITRSGLEELRAGILEKIKAEKESVPSYGLYGDTLIVRLIEAAAREGRPVYFASTLFSSEVINRYLDQGRHLGLVTLVTPPAESYRSQLRHILNIWIHDYRTGGLDSWHLRHSREGTFGRQLALNYAAGLYQLMDVILDQAPNYRLDLFHWYRKHLLELIPPQHVDELNKMWCRSTDIQEIRDWCGRQGYLE